MRDMLPDVVALVVEVDNLATSLAMPPFWEIDQEIVAAGFEASDLVESLYGPEDSAFWKADPVFARYGKSK